MTENRPCTNIPVSWLKLEQYALGYLTSSSPEIAEHIAECAACHACLQQIREDLRILPPLPQIRKHGLMRRLRAWFAIGVAPVLATAIVLIVLRSMDNGDNRNTYLGIKGDTLSMALVREHRGETLLHATEYVSGDRFKILVTCSDPDPQWWHVVAFQQGQATFPLDASERTFLCGNSIALPGAFRITGTAPTTVCVVVREQLLSQEQLAMMNLNYSNQMDMGTVCQTLWADSESEVPQKK